MTAAPLDLHIGFIGGGMMAEALVKGLLASGAAAPGRILVFDPSPERSTHLRAAYGVTAAASNAEVLAGADVAVLAVKPQVIAPVLAEIAPAVTDRHLVISIAAGVRLAALEAALPPGTRVVRVMPNTPALVQKGAAALCAGSAARPGDLDTARAVLGAVGTTVVVEERLMDAVTGLSGSGPAYVFAFVEGLVNAGVREGLPRPVAEELVLQTLEGAVRLCRETGKGTGELTAMVTSPGGTTIAGLHVLERGGFKGLLMDCVQAAARRSRELG
ncbi:pyrroline-5-carboxylate reductase [Dissulfurirhabdus thermomarina]|uniref:Pyrroline-5-carboxylate reductase n=1 Tax=Dissulfurirhabdus thermomarina TaxID=1765737 RepID=A0A6N9TTN4_DISTH|nr:pyrroline-5-carboxylate reductase [Dissulfurirhabdus thermomarina]NDY42797.1 pyrroline-5-carboxylate reductase [Dissulfurirhabdus thermomarina]NMX23861.1 pyrroline-5-carboxylate reductase [Dissulfurirhabdus thermomarina]